MEVDHGAQIGQERHNATQVHISGWACMTLQLLGKIGMCSWHSFQQLHRGDKPFFAGGGVTPVANV
jgi:hypothetical protein